MSLMNFLFLQFDIWEAIVIMFCFVRQETVAAAIRENVLSSVQILISFNFTVKNFYKETFSGTNFHEVPAILVSWH